jgi:TIGR03009 family protein
LVQRYAHPYICRAPSPFVATVDSPHIGFRIEKDLDLMSRTTRRAFVSCLIAGSLTAATSVLAQRPLPGNDPPKRERPKAAPLRVQNVPPQLMSILQQWSAATDKITRLSGEQHRWVYDTVFKVEKRSEGNFYYESPGSGRIDINAKAIPKGAVSRRKDKKTGKPFEVKPDQSVRWVCDGKRIMQLDVAQKQADIFPIPVANQGRNIMDGPLPFLFGMPPQKALQRYQLELVKNAPDKCYLKAIPRWRSDAANYKEATIILDKKLWLPQAVKMIDPAGTRETVYFFQNLQVNPRNFVPWWKGDKNPFKPNLRNWKIVNKPPPAKKAPNRVRQAAGNAKKPAGGIRQVAGNTVKMPSLVGLPAGKARDILTQLGLKADYRAGKIATRRELLYVIYGQQPLAGTMIAKDKPVVLTYYGNASSAKK